MTEEGTSHPLREHTKECDLEAQQLAEASHSSIPQTLTSGQMPDPTVLDTISSGPTLTQYIDKVQNFIEQVKKGYSKDPLFAKVVVKPHHHQSFTCHEGLVYSKN
jgi:hypothetical protein